MDCRDCQWCWLSEAGDKYDDPDYMICDNGESEHCGQIIGNINECWENACEDFEEPL